MITIQELHSYHKLALKGFVPPINCSIDSDHGIMTPWVDEKEQPCLWCLACGSKRYLGLNKIEAIKTLLRH